MLSQKFLRRLHDWVLGRMRRHWRDLVAKNKAQGLITQFFAADEALQGMSDENEIPFKQVMEAPWESYPYRTFARR